MSFKIRINSSGHEFVAYEKESLLDAALRAGLNLNYSCASGSCGECRARVIEGQYTSFGHHDYAFSVREKQQNMVLMCSVAANSDLLIEAVEASCAADIPRQSISAKVAKVEAVDEQHRVVHLRTPRSRTLRFLAGQVVDLELGGLQATTLAVASCPCNGMALQFHVAKDGSDFSNYVFETLKASETVTVNGPSGDFALDEVSRRPIVMLAEDTGFAPIKSLIEHSIALEMEQSLTLFWLAGHGRGHYMENYCRAWENALDNFVYFKFDLENQQEQDYVALVQEVVARSPVESELDLYVAASGALTRLAHKAFGEKGTPESRMMLTNTY